MVMASMLHTKAQYFLILDKLKSIQVQFLGNLKLMRVNFNKPGCLIWSLLSNFKTKSDQPPSGVYRNLYFRKSNFTDSTYFQKLLGTFSTM